VQGVLQQIEQKSKDSHAGGLHNEQACIETKQRRIKEEIGGESYKVLGNNSESGMCEYEHKKAQNYKGQGTGRQYKKRVVEKGWLRNLFLG